jgi:hypothetical protein
MGVWDHCAAEDEHDKCESTRASASRVPDWSEYSGNHLADNGAVEGEHCVDDKTHVSSGADPSGRRLCRQRR